MQFQILIFDGFEEMDVFGVFEPLRMAGLDVKLVSLDAQESVSGFYGTRVIADGILEVNNKPDVLIVPGGGWLVKSSKGAWAEAENGTMLKAIKSFYEAGCVIASVCAGSMLLARAGLLLGRYATSNKLLLTELGQHGTRVIEARVVDDGDIVTAGGITSSIDLGVWLVERFLGVNKALEVSSKLEFESRGCVWKSGDADLEQS
jgi:transcriptional regulator GlxA family with amidase domain